MPNNNDRGVWVDLLQEAINGMEQRQLVRFRQVLRERLPEFIADLAREARQPPPQRTMTEFLFHLNEQHEDED